MIRVRVTFSVVGLFGTLTHEILVPEVETRIIRQTLNDDLKAMVNSVSLQPMKVKDIILIVDLPAFSPVD